VLAFLQCHALTPMLLASTTMRTLRKASTATLRGSMSVTYSHKGLIQGLANNICKTYLFNRDVERSKKVEYNKTLLESTRQYYGPEIIEEKPNFCGLDLSKLSTGDDVPTSNRKRKRGDYENFNSRLLNDITSIDKDDSEEKDDER
ncbi:8972_t:CDS:2, partial [Funneliformis mosseae]